MSLAALEVAVEQELDRRECAADPAVFTERHGTVEDPDGTVHPFRLWTFQRETLHLLHQGENIIVLKARRLGLSWVVLVFALWYAIFHQGTRVLILCKTGDDAAALLDRIRRMRDRIAADPASAHVLAKLEQPAKIRDAVTTLDVGSSTIRALMGTPAAARSETAGLLLLDEFAFQRGADEIWQAVLPTIEGGGQAAVVSTGNGDEKSSKAGAEFAKQWSRAKRAISEFTPLFFPWMARPDRDAAWKQRTIGNLGSEERFKVEYPETEADAFIVADADLLYPGPHMDAVESLGREFDEHPERAVFGPLWLGIDWGVSTHMVLARRMASGGVHVIGEWHSTNADLDADVAGLCAELDRIGIDPEFLRYDPGAAGAKVIGTFVKMMRERRPRFQPRVMKIPFSKFKLVAIRYTKQLARRSFENEQLRVLAISPEHAPEALRQMRGHEWKDADAAKTEKGDDHGADAVLTLTAELGYQFEKSTQSDHDVPRR